MSQQVLSITQINEYIRTKMDGDNLLSGIAVRGEISNYKVYPSGHHYFTLKDEGAALKCVMFKSSAVRLRFRPENGLKVIAIGRITVYPRDGMYQLYCNAMTADGIGDLQAAFEQLKTKLSKEGLFDSSHKKPIPQYPGTIGIITSSAGAAVHDMIRILKKRYPLTSVKLLPVRVQGAEAPGEISAAIRFANYYNLADLLIVGRGGGSIEDLWAFNDEQVAYAIYESNIPVISAVGHEPDVTISDYVADLRAATPSNAAELAVQDQDSLRQILDTTSATLASALFRQIKSARQHLNVLSASNCFQSPTAYFSQKRQLLHSLTNRITSKQIENVSGKRQRYAALTGKLDAMSPLKVLSRGYTMTYTDDRTLLRTIKQVQQGDRISVQLSDGSLNATVSKVKENV